MKASRFETELEKLAGAPGKKFNTNNGSVFGGRIGRRYSIGPCVVSVGVASTRHHGTFNFITIKYDFRRVFDEENTAKNQQRALKTVAEICREAAQ